MKTKHIFELKTLFDPLTLEWEETTYEEKRKLIEDVFGNKQISDDGFKLLDYINNSMYLNSNGEYIEPTLEEVIKANEEDKQPLVSFYNLLLAVGFYLNKSIDNSFEFPDKIEKVKFLFSRLEELKDGRTKRNRFVYEKIFIKSKDISREIFDLYGEGRDSSKLPGRIEKLKKLNDLGATPIEILFCHVYNDSRGNGKRMFEAPYAAFALCWNGNELI